jgi:hypothetical protein
MPRSSPRYQGVTSQKKKAAQGRKKATGKAAKPAKPAKAAASQPRQSRKKTDTPDAPQNPRAPKPESKGSQLLAFIGREQWSNWPANSRRSWSAALALRRTGGGLAVHKLVCPYGQNIGMLL